MGAVRSVAVYQTRILVNGSKKIVVRKQGFVEDLTVMDPVKIRDAVPSKDMGARARITVNLFTKCVDFSGIEHQVCEVNDNALMNDIFY